MKRPFLRSSGALTMSFFSYFQIFQVLTLTLTDLGVFVVSSPSSLFLSRSEHFGKQPTILVLAKLEFIIRANPSFLPRLIK